MVREETKNTDSEKKQLSSGSFHYAKNMRELKSGSHPSKKALI